jgi:hexosaminidase
MVRYGATKFQSRPFPCASGGRTGWGASSALSFYGSCPHPNPPPLTQRRGQERANLNCPVKPIRFTLKRRALLLLAELLLAACDSSAPSRATPNVIPAPREVIAESGEFVLKTDTTVAFSAGGEAAARYFIDLNQRTRGQLLQVGNNNDAGIRFELDTRKKIAKDGYSLAVRPERIVVSASDATGLFYGAVTLWQLITSTADAEIRLPAVTINDAPRFRWRGLMLDSARHYQSPEFIKRFIDVMATHKLNVLHWHLTDDQAWRLEIKKYPKLTEVSAWRVPAGEGAEADIDPKTNQPRKYGGFYSQDDVRDIVAYAAARHITIVPEIEMPGHASAPIAAYPQLGVAGNAVTTVPADWGVYPNLYNVNESTFAFLEDVLSEVLALFPSEYIHVGGDEAVKKQWEASPLVQARMRELGIADAHRLQSYFIQRMGKFLHAQGRRLIGWDEILEGGLASNATVMSWRGIDGAIAAAQAGHDTVLSPHPTLYFDNRPYDARVPGRGRVLSLEDVYRFDPAPTELTAAQRQHVLGVQANIWTEHIRTEQRVDYMTFPRAAALAEIAWSAPARLAWADFSRRLPAQLKRYDQLRVGYANVPVASSDGSTRYWSHDLQLCSENISLSLEDDAPVSGARAVFLVDIMNPCWKLTNVRLDRPLELSASVGQVPFNFQIGDDIHKVVLRRAGARAGELQVRLGCDGELIASVPLGPALSNPSVTRLANAQLPSRSGTHELCFQFTQAQLDPLWVIDRVELKPESRPAE